MKPRKHFVVVLTYCVLLVVEPITANAESTDTDIKTAIVQVFTDSVARSHVNPWQVSTVAHSSGSGVIIDGNRILTAAHVVDNAMSIYVRKTGSHRRYKALAKYIGDASDLAIITVNDDDFFVGTSNLPIGTLPKLGDEVTTWGFPKGGSQVALTKGIVSRIDFHKYTHSGSDNLVCQVDAAINSGASGGAAVVDERLAGITFQSLANDSTDNVGYVIPVPVINQFLKDTRDGEVNGVPTIAIRVQHMENPQLREFYGMTGSTGGVLVTDSRGEPENETNAVKVGDIVLQIDNVPVGNDGTVPFQSGDRIDASFFVTRHQIGDTIPIRLLRAGKEVVIDYALKYTLGDVMLITPHFSGFVPDHEVVGGFAFLELNEDYLKNEYGEYASPDWMGKLDEIYASQWWIDKETAVFISTILADEINVGYDAFKERRVVSVNGKKIRNLDALRQAMSANKSQFHVFEFNDPYGQIVLNRQLVQEREPIIRERYKLGKP